MPLLGRREHDYCEGPRVHFLSRSPVLPNRIYANFVAKTRRLHTLCPLIGEIENAGRREPAGCYLSILVPDQTNDLVRNGLRRHVQPRINEVLQFTNNRVRIGGVFGKLLCEA